MTPKSNSSIEDRLDAEAAAAWKPEAGEKLIGEVVSVGERDSGYGSYPVLRMRRDDGEEVAVHAFRTVLASRLAEVWPKPGARIGIKYEGEREGGEHRYHSYRVVVDRPERPVDWSTYSEDVPAGANEDQAAATQTALEAERDERDAALSHEGVPS